MNIISEIVRPQNISEVVGLEHIKTQITYDVLGAKELKQALPHYLIIGPAGSGKTSISNIIASFTGGQVLTMVGSNLKTYDDVLNVAAKVNSGDVIFVDEAGGIGGKAQLSLLTWLEEYKLYNAGEMGVSYAPHVSFIFSTTNPNFLSKPLRDRCKILGTNYYTVDEIKQILLKAGTKLGIDLSIDDDALTLLAQSSRGTPRTAINNRLDTVRKIMTVDKSPFNVALVKKMLQINGVNEWGLESSDIKYCQTLYDKMKDSGGKPIAKRTLSQSLGYGDDDIVNSIIEPYLQQLGVISIEPRGRILTSFGCSMIGVDPIKMSRTEMTAAAQIDKELLIKLLEDPLICKSGLKGLAEKLSIRYPQDTPLLKEMLYELGYESIQKAGIRKCENQK